MLGNLLAKIIDEIKVLQFIKVNKYISTIRFTDSAIASTQIMTLPECKLDLP
jgi:hypothetical protein